MHALSNTKLKFFDSLKQKKYRKEHGLYLAEGIKVVQEAFLTRQSIHALVVSTSFLDKNTEIELPADITWHCSDKEFLRLSDLQAPEGILAVLQIPVHSFEVITPAFALWEIQDPGNVGTLLRTADWFGFQAMYCSEGTVDCFNSKVVRASMGSLFRLKVFYLDRKEFDEFVETNKTSLLATSLRGTPINELSLTSKNMFLLGNEAQGLPLDYLEKLQNVTIPRRGAAESLNVSSAGAVLAYCLSFSQNH